MAENAKIVIPVNYEIAADMKHMHWQMEAMFSRGIFGEEPPLTEEEERTGWRSFTDSAGTTDKYAVGWRAEQQLREYEARKAAEMATCPYVACTCGWHEED